MSSCLTAMARGHRSVVHGLVPGGQAKDKEPLLALVCALPRSHVAKRLLYRLSSRNSPMVSSWGEPSKGSEVLGAHRGSAASSKKARCPRPR